MKCGMKKGGDARKGMLKNKDKMSTKLNKMSLGPAESAGPFPGARYFKGGKVDGCIKKGHTKGAMK